MQSVDKKYFLFNKGINTEAPLVAWPEGFTVDEQNFDLLPDGSRKRRLGLSYEAGGPTEPSTMEGASTDLSSGTRFYRWKNVANTDELNLIVLQVGSSLYFWEDVDSGPLGIYLHEFLLDDYKVSFVDPVTEEAYAATTEQLKSMVCSFSEADGKLIVVGEHINPFFISYVDNTFVGEVIKITERDLFGIDDGVAVAVMPKELTPQHQYNLYDRGWLNSNIEAVKTDTDLYPAKNMVQFLGLRKQTESGYSDDDGIKVFSPDKLMGELFQNMSAPLGHITRDVFNRREAIGSLEQGTDYKLIKSIDSVSSFSGLMTFTTVDAAHDLNVNDEIYIDGLVIKWERRSGRASARFDIDMSGPATVTEVVDGDTVTVQLDQAVLDKIYEKFFERVISLGQFSVGGILTVEEDDFAPAKTRFSVTAAFAGRVFYSGATDVRLTDRVYFSKVIEDDSDFGKCLQEADPTSEYISDLLPSDGGYITIPNMGTVRGMVPYGGALLLLTSEGVWAIGPGEGGIFSAVGYSVKKISDAGCVGAQSIIVADNVPMYWSNAGIYAIIQDSNSGFLTGQNITQDTINGLFASIRHTEKTRVKASYDPIRKRVFFLYNSRQVNPSTGVAPRMGESDVYSTTITPLPDIDNTEQVGIYYDTALIFDLRLTAWTKWVFGLSNTKVRDIFCLPTNYREYEDNNAIRFLCQIDSSVLFHMGALTSPSYEDWGVESNAYLYTGPDSLGEPERFRYAPYVHVFMRKESTSPIIVAQSVAGNSSISVGSPLDITVYSRLPSLYMQPRWDWARGSDSGKIQNYVQVYRETKPNTSSFGMVVTKNKIRGRGRNLFLAFKAGEKAPAWLDGWTVKYDAQVRI